MRCPNGGHQNHGEPGFFPAVVPRIQVVLTKGDRILCRDAEPVSRLPSRQRPCFASCCLRQGFGDERASDACWGAPARWGGGVSLDRIGEGMGQSGGPICNAPKS